jgi:alkylation response protein AidB-like acyl-CoA dehydrogenase
VACAFAGGYQAALRALVPSLPEGALTAFCATETGGNHPRAIETRLSPAGAGFTLGGAKRWSTMGPLADVLLVVASAGIEESGRNRLCVVRVEAAARGVSIATMPPTRFVPEVPHAVIDFQSVAVEAGAVLPGDGYARYLKPFRTIEDIHVHAATMGYGLSAARRNRFPDAAAERITASLLTARTLAALDPSAPETHLALAGHLAEDARLLDDLADAWSTVPAPERERWERDRALFGSVAGPVREQRRRRAWETVGTGHRTPAAPP